MLVLGLLGIPIVALTQDETTTFPLERFYTDRKKNARSIFKNFRLGVSVGYGRTYFSHDLKGFAIYQEPGKGPEIFNSDSLPTSRFKNWVNTTTRDNLSVQPGSSIFSSATSKIGFKGKAWNIPLKLTLHYEFKRYRIGGGYSWEYMNIGIFRPISHGDVVGQMHLSASSGLMKKYFGSLGVSFARIDNYLFTGDIDIGGFKPGNNFNKGLIKKGIYVNVGITVERGLSEYLRVFLRPSFDYKYYSLQVSNKTIHHSINALYLNIGLTYTLPEFPKCFKKECSVQINHAHGNRQYRSRVHPIYKKQNPGYGENNPPVRLKGQNKKKLNPY